MFRRTAAFGLVTLGLASAAFSQPPQAGTIAGSVSDHTGARAPGVTVRLTSDVWSAARSAVTDAQGAYRFPSLAPGRYTITFELSGFRKLTRSDVFVSSGGVATVDATLEVGTINETVEVAGPPALVDVTRTDLVTTVDGGALQKLPAGRDAFTVLQTLVPQVVFDREDVGGSEGGRFHVFSANGSTWRQNTYAFNGMDVLDPAMTGSATYDYDSLEQIHVSTAQHPPEVGPPGVYVNLVAKRGSDTFQGGASYYFENKSLVADNLTPSQRQRGIVTGAGVDLFSDANLHIGGPLVKDKLRFFASARDWRIHRAVPGFPTTDDTGIRSALADLGYQLGPSRRLELLATVQTYYKPHEGAAAQISPETTWVEDDVFRIFQASYGSPLATNALLDVRIGYADVRFPLEFQPDATRQFSTEGVTGRQTGAASIARRSDRSRLAAKAALSLAKARWARASHHLKVGYELGRQASNSEQDSRDGVWLYTLNGAPAFLLALNTPVQTRSRWTDHIGFVQDNVSAGRFDLNVGLRLQHTSGYLPAHSSPAGPFVEAQSFPRQDVVSWTSLAPRVGLVYDVKGDHTAALKLGYGRYHHQLNPEPIEVVQNDLAFTDYQWNDANGDRQFQPGEQGDSLFSFPGRSITTVDPKVRRPHTDEVTAGFELQLPAQVKLTVDGVFRWGKDLLATQEVGIPQDGSAYTPATALDPGPDGRPGTPDDRTLTVYNLRPEFRGAQRRLVTNREDFTTDFKGLVVILQRRFAGRWQGLLAYSLSKDNLSRASTSYGPFFGGEEESAGRDAFLDPNSAINNSGGPSFFDRRHSLKLSGSYEIPKLELALAAIFKLQTGLPYARFVSLFGDVDEVAFNQGRISFYAEPRDARRLDTLKVLDLRLSKSFALDRRHRLEAVLDVFNVFNVNVVTSLNGNTGREFDNPQDILGPRAARLGLRWTF